MNWNVLFEGDHFEAKKLLLVKTYKVIPFYTHVRICDLKKGW
jgi:hypothetical protein